MSDMITYPLSAAIELCEQLDNDTPETQKAVLESNGQWSFVLKECCEKLERERDEARNLACVYQHQYYIHVHPNTIPPYFIWQRRPEPM